MQWRIGREWTARSQEAAVRVARLAKKRPKRRISREKPGALPSGDGAPGVGGPAQVEDGDVEREGGEGEQDGQG